MASTKNNKLWRQISEKYPEKTKEAEIAFGEIKRGDRIFVGTGCGEPQHLISSLAKYIENNPKAFSGAEIFHVWSLGVTPYADEKFSDQIRHNSFFIGNNTRDAVNRGVADYTPIFLSQVPPLIRNKYITFDVALVQVSPPDFNGFMSLGVSIDITKEAADSAGLLICQINPQMPRVHGDAYLNAKDADYLIPCDEPLLEYAPAFSTDIAEQIGSYAARIIEDGDTIQIGYGAIPNAILSHFIDKKDLGVHTELISDGIVMLMEKGVINNSNKTLNRGKTVASFCMGSRSTYDYIRDNPSIEFRPIDFTNNPLNIARQDRMVAINTAIEIDLTGQATAESIGKTFYSGIGGQADFMRGAVLSKGGKTILALPSTSNNGNLSRIVPFIREGAGVTLTRGDVHYVITEYGIAYLHGKNIRERAMSLISIAHPKFRKWLIEEAAKLRIIYSDQQFVTGMEGVYPNEMELYRTMKNGEQVFIRPVKISDESIIKDFFRSLSDMTLYRRFMTSKFDISSEWLRKFYMIDYTKRMVIIAIKQEPKREKVLGLGEFTIEESNHKANVAFIVRDDSHGMGLGTEIFAHLISIARKKGLLGFTAEVLAENRAVLHIFDKFGLETEKQLDGNTICVDMSFSDSLKGLDPGQSY